MKGFGLFWHGSGDGNIACFAMYWSLVVVLLSA